MESSVRKPRRGKRVAVFIDGDNVSTSCWYSVVTSLALVGDVVSVAAYATNANGWSQRLDVEFHAVPGTTKNAADFAICVAAGLVVGRKKADWVAIVTGDHGFASAIRSLRQKGVRVVVLVPAHAVGNHELLAAEADFAFLLSRGTHEPVGTAQSAAPHAVLTTTDAAVADVNVLRMAFKDLVTDKGGWVFLSAIGQKLHERGITRFKGRLREAVLETGLFETDGAHDSNLRIRLRPGVKVSPQAVTSANTDLAVSSEAV